MDFGWSDEEEDWYRRALRFATERLTPEASAGAPAGLWREGWRRAAEFGFLGLSVPEAHGGLGFDALRTAHLVEAMGRGCPDLGLVFSAMAQLFACAMPIAESGNEEQKRTWLPRLCDGSVIGANAISEAEAGSDVFALRTRAEADGDGFVINGTKAYVTNGPVADLFLVYASTTPRGGFLGISAFLVEADRPGVRKGQPFDKSGLRNSPTSAVYFEDCRVPRSALLGPANQGARVFTRSMHWERGCLFAAYLGAMERVLAETVEYARQRKQFRRPIGKQQAVSHRLVDMRSRLDSARLLLYRACWKMARGEDASLEVALSKVAVSEAAVSLGEDAIQLHGGMGVLEETGLTRFLADALPSRIFSGTNEIQREIAASRMGL